MVVLYPVIPNLLRRLRIIEVINNQEPINPLLTNHLSHNKIV